MHIMGLLSRHGQAKRRRRRFVPTALFCQSLLCESRTFHNARDYRMVQSGKSTHGLALSRPFYTPHEGSQSLTHLGFTSSPQTLYTQGLGVRGVNQNGCCPKTSNCFRRMAGLCESFSCAWFTAIYTPRTEDGPISENKGCTKRNRKKQTHQ